MSSNRRSVRLAQTTVDARLNTDFEHLGNSFDYSVTVSASAENLPPVKEKVTAYLQQIQKGKLIQPFGCLLAIDEKNFQIIACSENASEMLTVASTHAVPTLGDNNPGLGIGTDVRTLFTSPSSTALQKAIGFADVSLLNPILLHCKPSGKPFYGIMHRVTGCLVIDFEPVKPCDLPITAAGALQSYKLAAKAISRLQSLPTGSMKRLCDTIVEEVFHLTGYDRVMAYKFHEDDHGEVVSELTKPGLEPYLGLHYPATDIPQASRFLFMKNKVRIICDCHAKPVKVNQDDRLDSDLTFCGSTLRAPHGCHTQYMENMNSIASLVLAVVVNENEDVANPSEPNPPESNKKRLWGLVVCHNRSPRFVPFPLRYACEFLAQVFATHVNMEFELENQIHEKYILRTQTLLCDMLMRDALPGIMSQTPNIMNLVKCDGAALMCRGKIWRLGNCPLEHEIISIADWLAECHMDSTGLSTDSLHDAGYPGALSLGNQICGMAAARINSRDIVFWFRSHTASEIRWGGAKHEAGDQDDGRRMHPRSSFNAFLEVVKTRSFPWKDFEMDAIHSLQLILRGNFTDGEKNGKKKNEEEEENSSMNIDGSGKKDERFAAMLELQTVTSEMVRLIETATVPIFAVDADGCVNGWNLKIAELTGLQVEQAMGKNILSLVEDNSIDTVKSILKQALEGHEEKNIQFALKTHNQMEEEGGPVFLIVNSCASRDLNKDVVGVCFVAQDLTSHKLAMDKFTRIEGDYKAIVQNPNPLIPPIFGVDEFGWCSEWNSAMAKISGWPREEMIDKMLLGEIFGTHMAYCRLKNQDALVHLGVLINNAMIDKAIEQEPFTFLNSQGKEVKCLVSINKKTHSEDATTGVFCFLHIASHDLQKSIHLDKLSEQSASKQLKALSYIRNEIRNPLSGMMFARKMMETTELNEEQRRLIKTGENCHLQLYKILGDMDLDSITDSCLNLDMSEFVLKEMLVTAISQVMITSRNKSVRIMHDLSQELMNEEFYGDCLRLQQIVSDFLLVSVNSSPSGGQVEIVARVVKDKLSKALHVANLDLRISHTGGRVSETLLSQMFGNSEGDSEDGINLLICRKLLLLMNGDVRYLSEAGKSSFIISVELASSKTVTTKAM